MSCWAQECSKNGDSSLGFTYKNWYLPTPALTLRCWDANPYRRNMFQYYDMTQFETFMFSSCSLPPMPFSDMLTNLRVRTLIFSSKTVTTINPDILQNLPYLTFLDLSNNLLTTLTFNFFNSLTNVSSVSLGLNSLTFLPEDVFFKLNLFHIDLGDNKLESLPEKIFKGQFEIKDFIFEQKTQRNLAFTNPPNLKDVKIQEGAKNKFICDVEENCTEECKCYTREVDKTTFIDCSNSHLETIPTRVFRNASILLMNINRNSYLSGLSKTDWKHLREMSFENNQIISENWELPPSLEYINLKNDRLSWLSPYTFNYSAPYSDFKIKLGGNPWKCNCNLTSMRYWLISLKGKVIDPEKIICEDPIIKKGKYVYPRIDKIQLNNLCHPHEKK
ncbi:hypothetical protein LAZ67_5000955 [Cordylochernes scorpioides]|uniref:Uncharacterized protein n=1 Tax=Cordylochernes scorpioides TaxID=51811 RepID=A0ABY6KFG9_9ARAC|nr:hypothetical protein LAZ67_5000955 [Cordylochernes scorpioides]